MILDGQKSRLAMMLAVNAACSVLAGAAMVGVTTHGLTLLLPVCVAFIGAAIGAQLWFLVGWAKAARARAHA